VGKAGSAQGIAAAFSAQGPAAAITLTVDDSADATARTVTLGSFTPGDGSTWGTLTGIAPAAVNYQAASLADLTVKTGTAAGTVVDVQATQAATTIVGHGAMTVNVGNAGSVQAIAGALNLDDPGSSQTVVLDDSSDHTGRVATLSGFTPRAIRTPGAPSPAWRRRPSITSTRTRPP
jgi:hypothetical protein